MNYLRYCRLSLQRWWLIHRHGIAPDRLLKARRPGR